MAVVAQTKKVQWVPTLPPKGRDQGCQATRLYQLSVTAKQRPVSVAEVMDVLHFWHNHRGVKIRQRRLDKTQAKLDSDKIAPNTKYIEDLKTANGGLSEAFLQILTDTGKIRGHRNAARHSVVEEVRLVLQGQSWLDEQERQRLIEAFVFEEPRNTTLRTRRCSVYSFKTVAQSKLPDAETFSALNTLTNVRLVQNDQERPLTNQQLQTAYDTLCAQWSQTQPRKQISIRPLLKIAGILPSSKTSAITVKAADVKVNVPYTAMFVKSLVPGDDTDLQVLKARERVQDLLLTPFVDDYASAVEDLLAAVFPGQNRTLNDDQDKVLSSWSAAGRSAFSRKAILLLNKVMLNQPAQAHGQFLAARKPDDACFDFYQTTVLLQWPQTPRLGKVNAPSARFAIDAATAQVQGCLKGVKDAIANREIAPEDLEIVMRVELARELTKGESERAAILKSNMMNGMLRKKHEKACAQVGAHADKSWRRFKKFLAQGGSVDKDGKETSAAIGAWTGRSISLAQALLADGVNLDHAFNRKSSGVDDDWNIVLDDEQFNKKVKGDKLPSELDSSMLKDAKKRLKGWARKHKSFDVLLERIDFDRQQAQSLAPSSLSQVSALVARQTAQAMRVKISQYLPGAKVTVQIVKGYDTAYLRQAWGLHNLNLPASGRVVGTSKDRNDHRHHIVDSFVIAHVDDASYAAYKKDKRKVQAPPTDVYWLLDKFEHITPVRLYAPDPVEPKYAPNPIGETITPDKVTIHTQYRSVNTVLKKIWKMHEMANNNGYKLGEKTVSSAAELVTAVFGGSRYNNTAADLPLSRNMFELMLSTVETHGVEVKKMHHVATPNGLVHKVKTFCGGLSNLERPQTGIHGQRTRVLEINPLYKDVAVVLDKDNVRFVCTAQHLQRQTQRATDAVTYLKRHDELMYTTRTAVPKDTMLDLETDVVFYAASFAGSNENRVIFAPVLKSEDEVDQNGKLLRPTSDPERLLLHKAVRVTKLPLRLGDKSLWKVQRDITGRVIAATCLVPISTPVPVQKIPAQKTQKETYDLDMLVGTAVH
ncbi:MAG: hypothetical protein JSS66_06255 [Armatimonadetes bacterium]|nr:hypothetical protein [Armatimonadota bacterium]